MAEKRVRITSNPTKAHQRLEKLLKKMDRKFILQTNKKISILLDHWVQRNFKGQGKLVGGWKKLKLGGRRTKGGGIDTKAQILQDTGHLRINFTPFYSKRVVGIENTRTNYAPVHEFGLGKVPERRMLPTTKEVRFEVNRIVDLAFKQEKAKHGLK